MQTNLFIFTAKESDMKKSTLAIVITALISACFFLSCKGGEKTKLTISGAWALYPMAVTWAEEYRRDNPDVIIDISAGGAGKGMADALSGVVDLGMVSRDVTDEEISKGAWWVSVVKDAVVPTINAKNPLAAQLCSRGLSKNEFKKIWVAGTLKKWNTLVQSAKDVPVHVYTRSDACGAAETWAKYLDSKQESLKGVGVYGDPGVADAVKNDVLGVGFNNINYAYDAGTKKPIEGLSPLPLDLDGNGRIDEKENFYTSRDSIMKAIADGQYPSPPARNLHMVSGGKPKNEHVMNFLKWIITDGQKFVDQAGYIQLSSEVLKQQADKLK
jgi:phosphate transport system substrate-binding protein